MFIIPGISGFGVVHADDDDDSPTAGKSSSWPDGEPRKVREAHDAQRGDKG
jgi:hypothetical protein